MEPTHRNWLHFIAPEPHHVGRTPAWRHWSSLPRQLYDHELMLLIEGRWSIEDDGVRYPMEAPSFFIFRPGIGNAISRVDVQRMVYAWVHFDWMPSANPRSLLQGGGLLQAIHPAQPNPAWMRPAPDFVPPGPWHGPVRNPATVFDLLERLLESWSHGSAHEAIVSRALLLQILLELLDTSERTPRGQAPGERLAHKARVIFDRLAESPRREQPPIPEAVRDLGRSYGHVARVFRQVYGITPLAYLNARRIHRARLLLLDTELNVSEIADRCGFESAQDFNRVFRRLTGRRPTDLRRSRRRRAV